MKFVLCTIILTTVFFSYALESKNVFKVEDIQEYVIPDNKTVTEVENSFLGFLKIWVFHKLLSPVRPKEMPIVAKCMSGTDIGREFVLRLKKGHRFSLPYGRYKLYCTGRKIVWEEMISEQNRRRNLPDVELAVPPDCWSPGKERLITIYSYPQDALVNIRGRVVDQNGKGIPGVSVDGFPCVRDPYDVTWYPATTVSTGIDGVFEFAGIPPASLDLSVRFLLFGRVMKSTYDSERIFDFGWKVKNLPSDSNNLLVRGSVSLVSERNLKTLLPFGERLRTMNGNTNTDKLEFEDLSAILKKFPVSTNNVIYVGDIVLPDKKQQGKN